jgi:hypothetical protein
MKQFIVTITFSLSLLSCAKHERNEVIYIDNMRQSFEQLEKLRDSEIFSYEKYRPGYAPEFYCKTGDSSVIVVKTKNSEKRLQQERYLQLNHILDSVDNGADILLVIDGIICETNVQKELRKIPADSLRYVDTMSFLASKRIYGQSARPLTLVINTYSLKYNKHL